MIKDVLSLASKLLSRTLLMVDIVGWVFGWARHAVALWGQKKEETSSCMGKWSFLFFCFGPTVTFCSE